MLGGLSCRDYEAAAEAVPEAFGLKRSSVSRRFIRSSARDSAPADAVFGERAQVLRCQWRKRENVVRYLPKSEQPEWRRKLQAAYVRPTYSLAKAALMKLHTELVRRNSSAAKSLMEGLDETLTMHRLGVFQELGISLKTTNLIESMMARVEERTARVDRWSTSDQKQRWCASAILEHERRFRRIKGYQYLPLLARALATEHIEKTDETSRGAAA